MSGEWSFDDDEDEGIDFQIQHLKTKNKYFTDIQLRRLYRFAVRHLGIFEFANDPECPKFIGFYWPTKSKTIYRIFKTDGVSGKN
jgi:hypothetical protein